MHPYPPAPSPSSTLKPIPSSPLATCLRAFGNARDVGAATVGLTTGDSNIAPGPASAGRAAAAGDNNIVSGARDGTSTSDVLDNKASDGDSGAGCALEVTAVVVLLDERAVPSLC